VLVFLRVTVCASFRFGQNDLRIAARRSRVCMCGRWGLAAISISLVPKIVCINLSFLPGYGTEYLT
jgi:hypothetical protein